MLNIIKYIKKAYVMSVASNLTEGPWKWLENVKVNLNINDTYSDTKKILEKALENWNVNSEEEKNILSKIEEKKNNIDRILKDKEKINEIVTLWKKELLKTIINWVTNSIAQDFAWKTVNGEFGVDKYWNIAFSSSEYVWKTATGYKTILNTEMLSKMWINTDNLISKLNKQISIQKENQEKIAISEKKDVKWFNNDMFKKAEDMISYSKNPDFKNKWLDLKIEDGKVVLYNPKGERIKYFTIPTMNKDWTINNEENLARLKNPKVLFQDFVKKYIPEVKTYAEIWQENIQNTQKQEKMAALIDEVWKHNENIFNITEKSINFIKNTYKLPKWVKLVLNGNKVELQNKWNVEWYFTLNLKNSKWELIHPENNGRNIYGWLKKWVKTVLERKKIIPKNSKLDIV